MTVDLKGQESLTNSLPSASGQELRHTRTSEGRSPTPRPRCIDDIVDEMDANRQALAERVRAIRADPALSAPGRARRLREAWIGAMRRHYVLLDAYLAAPMSTECAVRRRRAPISARLLRAPERPHGVPEAIRPNLTVDLD